MFDEWYEGKFGLKPADDIDSLLTIGVCREAFEAGCLNGETMHDLQRKIFEQEGIIAELKEQIEKMKSCKTCAHRISTPKTYCCDSCHRHSNWELEE
ncbi:MAG: hypothetical protein IKK38_06435 [Spirochaetaceae bacterium]|nr:hypothetical protein [Spirochaetaceae bacterium]